MKLEKDEQVKPKVRRKKEIIKGIENKKKYRKSTTPKASSLEKVIKLINLQQD